MRDRLGEGGAAQRLVAGFAPPFDRELGLAAQGEMMRERLGLRRGRGQQNLGRAPMQRLAAAFQTSATNRPAICRWTPRVIHISPGAAAPGIVKAAIEGRLPRGFGVTRLTDPPMVWSDQWVALGIKAPRTNCSQP